MLHRLLEYAEQKGIAAEAGFRPKAVRWLLQFTPEGRYVGAVDLAQASGRKDGREFPKAPHLKFSGDTPMRQFLVDTARFAVLLGEDDPDEKLLAKRSYFLNLLRQAAGVEPFLGRVADALADESVRARIVADLEACSPKAKPTDNVSVAELRPGQPPRILVEQSTWHDWWREHFPTLFPQRKKGGQMRCLLSGELDTPARTHPKVKGLGDVGGNIETTLVGFNLDAFCSYGLKQSANAAIAPDRAQQYAAALNDLLADPAHTQRLAGAKVVYWYDREVDLGPLEQVFHPDLDFGDAAAPDDEEPEDGDAATSAAAAAPPSPRAELQGVKKARELLTAIRDGRRPDLADCRYHALTLSGNAGRVVVRDWMEGRFEDLLANVLAWFDDLEIVNRHGQDLAPPPKFGAVLAATARELADVPAPLATALWEAAVQRRPIPYQAMAQTLQRVRLDVMDDRPANHARMGLLKAYLIRKEICAMTPHTDDPINHPAYVCGQIMAVLAMIQARALPGVGAGIVQRYYAAASATPALILGRLVRLANTGHLPKIQPEPLRNWFEQQLAQAWDRLDGAPPRTLTLEEQSLFALGYYKQRVRRAPAADDSAGEGAEPAPVTEA